MYSRCCLRASLKGTGIGFVAGAMFKENAVSPADRGLAVAPRVPGKTNRGAGLNRCPVMQPAGVP